MTDGVTSSWVAQQVLKASLPVQEGFRDGVLVVWVPGIPRHFKGKLYGWAEAKHTKELRERTWARVVEVAGLWKPRSVGATTVSGLRVALPWNPTDPKRVAFTVYGRSRFDSDENLRLTCSPIKDALQVPKPGQIGLGIIDDDRDSSGHTFVYEQAKPTRSAGAIHGIAIRIELAEIVPAPVKGA